MTLAAGNARATLGLVIAMALLVAGPTPSAASHRSSGSARVTVTGPRRSIAIWPRRVEPGQAVVVTLTLPAGTAAADGRVIFDAAAAEFVGVAPVGGGITLYPEPVQGGVAFGAFRLPPGPRGTVLRFILQPLAADDLVVQVNVRAIADGRGRAGLGAGGPGWRPARPIRDQSANGRIDAQDLAAMRAAWYRGVASAVACAPATSADTNAEGCVDIVDLQAMFFARGTRTGPPAPAGSPGSATSVAASSPSAHTFTVTSSADTPDAAPGDGICADAGGGCSLRAALTEANALRGNDLIDFNLPGPAPVAIQLSNGVLPITALHGTVTIDGYSQPGSRVNSATVGSNAVPGVELRGNGPGADEDGLYISSMGNTVRGLVMSNLRRAVMLDGSDAHDNAILGNWLGFTAAGLAPPENGTHGVLLNTGASHNRIGSPNPADRNVIGNWTKAIDSYGPGTDYNTIQNNLLCIGPTGFTRATCGTGVDHDFGPKHELLGGAAPNTGNVIGPTTLQGIEYSHGWNPSDSTDTTTTWRITDNQALGNWVGFRGDGSYAADYRSGLLFGRGDNAQGINVYDGSSNNLIQGNVIASVYDGIQVMSRNATGNVVRGNLIGMSPRGEPAPLTGWGIKIRWATSLDVLEANTIRNAAAGGIGLVNVDNLGHAQSVAKRIRLSRNIVRDTNGPAILLAPSQSNPKDGANNLLRAPVITAASAKRVRGTGIPGATVEVFRATRAAGSFGLPDRYLGSARVAADGIWQLALSIVPAPARVTALQITPDQNSSALARNVKLS